MGLRPVTPTSSWWVLAVGRTRGEKNKGGGWEERRQRRGEGLRALLEGNFASTLSPSGSSHLGIRKVSGTDHGGQECELTHGFHSLIYGLFISF